MSRETALLRSPHERLAVAARSALYLETDKAAAVAIDVRFADACKVVSAFFGAPRQKGTSHRVWKMPWPGDPRVNLQMCERGKAKAYQVRQALQAIDRLRAQRILEAKHGAKGSKRN